MTTPAKELELFQSRVPIQVGWLTIVLADGSEQLLSETRFDKLTVA